MSTATNSLTWKMLETRWDKGFDALEPEEQEVLALYWLEAETMNGGLDQFFHNSSGDLALLALAGLKRLNCMQTHQVLSDIMTLVFGENYPIDRDERFPFLEEIIAKLGPDYERDATNFITDLPEEFLELAVKSLEKRYTSNNWVRNKWFLF
jgi:Domain of unknown function (DUF4375)